MYATSQDMIDRFGERELILATDRASPPAGLIDATVLARALEDAEAEINGYIAGRYTLPLADPPEILKRWSCDIAWFLLLRDGASEQVVKRYESIVKSLRMVNEGTLALGGASGEAAAPASSNSIQVEAPARVFTRESLSDY